MQVCSSLEKTRGDPVPLRLMISRRSQSPQRDRTGLLERACAPCGKLNERPQRDYGHTLCLAPRRGPEEDTDASVALRQPPPFRFEPAYLGDTAGGSPFQEKTPGAAQAKTEI